MITQTQIADITNTGGKALALLNGWTTDVQVPPLGNWVERSTAPGVVRYFDFNTDYPIGNLLNYGITVSTSQPLIAPVRDTAIKCSGVSSLRWDRPTLSGGDPCGAFYANFSDDLSVQFGEGDSFYVQMRVRWSQEFYETVFMSQQNPQPGVVNGWFTTTGTPTRINATTITLPGNQASIFAATNVVRADDASGIIGYGQKGTATYSAGTGLTTVTIQKIYNGVTELFTGATSIHAGVRQGGKKIFDVNAGDINPDPTYGDYARMYSSANAKIVVECYEQTPAPRCYAYDVRTQNNSLYETVGGTIRIQNAYAPSYAPFTGQTDGPLAGAFNITPNTWMTFQLGVTLGPLGTDINGRACWTQSRVRLWGAQENQPSSLLVDYKPTTNGYLTPPAYLGLRRAEAENTLHGNILPVRMGKVWLFPYLTTADITQPHVNCPTWYDELIISTQQIADPI